MRHAESISRLATVTNPMDTAAPMTVRVWAALIKALVPGSRRTVVTNERLSELAGCSTGSVTQGLNALERARMITRYYVSGKRTIQVKAPARKRGE